MKKWRPFILLALVAAGIYILYRMVRGQQIVPLRGWSPYNSSPMPSSPAPSSNVMGVGSPLR